MEIAIFKFDGTEIVDKFVSLINPERKIQSFVKKLTGIDEDVTRLAPKFHEVAKRIVEITEDCIIVAHNAQFDYRMLKVEFSRLGYTFKRETLCTVELSKKLIPDMPSYSLGKLTKSLGIPISTRHRAEGDALATVKLFKIILNKDADNSIIKKHIQETRQKQMDKKLLSILEPLPKETGVYFFYDKDENPLYIGKSNNIYKGVSQHFSNVNPKAKALQQKISYVKYELTGSELLALLKENEFVKNLEPIYNSALTKPKFSHGLYMSNDKKGYHILKIKPVSDKEQAISTFSSLKTAKSFLEQTISSHQLCRTKTSLGNPKTSCTDQGFKDCCGACVEDESPEAYNSRVEEAFKMLRFADKHMLLIGKGRNPNEKSLVYIKEGEIVGVGFFELNLQITNLDILERILFPIEHLKDAKHITQHYLRQYPNRVKVVAL